MALPRSALPAACTPPASASARIARSVLISSHPRSSRRTSSCPLPSGSPRCRASRDGSARRSCRPSARRRCRRAAGRRSSARGRRSGTPSCSRGCHGSRCTWRRWARLFVAVRKPAGPVQGVTRRRGRSEGTFFRSCGNGLKAGILTKVADCARLSPVHFRKRIRGKMGTTLEQLSQALALIHEAAASPERWTDAVVALTQICKSSKGAVLDLDTATGQVVGVAQSGHDPAAQQEYVQHYYAVDPTLEAALSAAPHHGLTTYEQFPASVRARNEYFAYMARYDVGDVIG